MKVKYFQRWTNIYGRVAIRKFKYWSNSVLGEGDETLALSKSNMLGFCNWVRKNWKWKKFIILVPKGAPETEFRMGFFSESFRLCKISSTVRKISDGPFAMRMGPEDCFFFVIGDGKIILEIAGYVRKDIWLY